LAGAVETAMYAPESLDAAQAEQAWSAADDVVAQAVRTSSLGRRLRWWLALWLVGTGRRA
jgi:hypothetical protein